MKRLIPALLGVTLSCNVMGSVKKADPLKTSLLKKFSKTYKNKKAILNLQSEVISYKGKAVPALVEVMKNSKYPDKNRWVATFLLGRVMGKNASAYISKYLKHPSWVMRMASLKTLMALKDKRYKKEYGAALKDSSFIVRNQALETIKKLDLKELAPNVWAMLYDKANYYRPKNKAAKRSNIIKKVIKTVGDLKFADAKTPLLKMIQKEKYKDVYPELEYALEKIMGKKAPNGKMSRKKSYWKKVALSELTI